MSGDLKICKWLVSNGLDPGNHSFPPVSLLPLSIFTLASPLSSLQRVSFKGLLNRNGHSVLHKAAVKGQEAVQLFAAIQLPQTSLS